MQTADSGAKAPEHRSTTPYASVQGDVPAATPSRISEPRRGLARLETLRTTSRFRTPRRWVLASILALAVLALSASAQAAITHPYTGISFGPGGVGSGAFGTVIGVAVQQSTGDVLVYESGNNGRVYKFDAGGKPVDFSSSSTNVIDGVGGTGGGEGEIAVDDSTGPDAGDIYVADNNVVRIYAESGAFLGELSGGEMCGVAVDTSGDVYVGIYSETVRRYAPVTNPVTNSNEDGSMHGLKGICNVAADGAGDVYAATFSGGVSKYDALQFGSLSAVGTQVNEKGQTLAIDGASEEVFIDERTGISQYSGNVEPPSFRGSTGAAQLSSSFGVAIDHASGKLYAGNSEIVDVFGPGKEVLAADTGPAANVEQSSATLHGMVEPSGKEVTSCVFEYGATAGTLNHQIACTPSVPYTGNTVEASATPTGLSEEMTYYYRITASGGGETVSGREASFTTKGPPVISEVSFHGVGTTNATVTGAIDGDGLETAYHVEYGLTSAYGTSTNSTGIGDGEATVAVQTPLAELQPGTSYHFRIVAESSAGTTYGPDTEFVTHPLVPTTLPDGRGYELVTPAQNEGSEPYTPRGAGVEGESAIETQRPMLAAANGESLVYVGSPNSGGNGSEGEGLGNEYLAHRTASGWAQENIQPRGYNSPVYSAFSEQLSRGIVMSREAIAPGGTAQFPDLYLRNDENATYQALSTVTPPNRTPYEFGAASLQGEVTEASLGERYAGASSNFTHLLFEANDALASPAVDPGHGANNLYDSVEGHLYSVNVLPDGSPAPNASFGGPTGPTINGLETYSTFSHAISADGSRIFWTDMENGSLYVREDDEHTTLIAEGATYLTASSDGSKVIYTKAGDLYEDDAGTTRDLAPGAEVLGLMGAGEDLEYIYFVAQGVLASGASAGQSNMYMSHEGHTSFIAKLGSESEEDETMGVDVTPWNVDLGKRAADVTPSGLDIVFMSHESLTGYDNVFRGQGETVAEAEVYRYDAGSGTISCLSCDPTGEPPSVERMGGTLPISMHSTYQMHVISDDGDRVFFESAQPLLPQAQNSRNNVYEWETDGSGSCAQANGCIFLISSGSSPYPSTLIDASATGDDVFLLTRSQLVPSDQNEYNNIYDARVGAAEAPAASQCTGTGCQGVAATPPVFATPASATYDGVGNFAPPPKAVAKPKPKPKKKASCTKARNKKSKAEQGKARRAFCKTKKAAKRVRRGTNGRGGR